MKNRIFLKAAALALTLCLSAPQFLSCQSGPLLKPQTQEPSAQASDEPTVSEQSPAHSVEEQLPKPQIGETFDGAVIRFAVCEEGENSRSIDLGVQDDPENAVNVQVKRRNEQVEKELDVKIELSKVVSMQKMISEMLPILTSKVYTYDVLGLYQRFDLGLCISDAEGCFYTPARSKDMGNYLNLDAPWWDRALFEEVAYRDRSNYYFTGDLNLAHTGGLFVSYVNTDLWADYVDQIAKLRHSGGYSDPYDIVKKGYWTMDLLIELADLLYLDNGNTKGEVDFEDQVGLMTYNEQLNNHMVDVLFAGSRGRYGQKDGGGTPVLTINSDQNKAFFGKLYTLLCESNAATIPWLTDETGADLSIMEVFKRGKTLVTLNTLSCAAEDLSDMEDDFYILPPPMLRHAQFDENSPSLGYASQLSDGISQYVICNAIGDEKFPAVTATLELMGYYSALWVTPAYVKNLLGKRYGDARAMELLELTKAGVYHDFVSIWSSELDNINWKFRTNYTKGGGGQAEKELRTWHRTVQGKLNKLLPLLAVYFVD
ncbi:MAG: hypothetical protein IJ344_00430 [Clostridia bacterium]|nr:hypothetical protein [Clostridia bacterium]